MVEAVHLRQLEVACRTDRHATRVRPRLLALRNNSTHDVSRLKAEAHLLSGAVPDGNAVPVGAAHLACSPSRTGDAKGLSEFDLHSLAGRPNTGGVNPVRLVVPLLGKIIEPIIRWLAQFIPDWDINIPWPHINWPHIDIPWPNINLPSIPWPDWQLPHWDLPWIVELALEYPKVWTMYGCLIKS